MRDLDIAKSRLFKEDATLVIAGKGKVLFKTDSHRISGFLGAIEQLGAQLEGAAVADRVAGKAMALLCSYAGISEVYAKVLSRKANGGSGQNNYMNGQIDEVRISNVVRSPEWLQTEYSNQNNPAGFITVGSEAQITV